MINSAIIKIIDIQNQFAQMIDTHRNEENFKRKLIPKRQNA